MEALVWYWTVSNILAFIQTLVLRQPAVRSFLNIPVPRTPPVLQKKRGFLDGFKESMNNSRLITEMETRERVNAKTWQKAGLKGAPTTYMSDPTKSTSQPKTVSAPGRIIDVQLDTKKKAVGR
ncbi:unnamed protein product [Trichobilharzia regenti]|nr:unnamed protein product [Trichobilharzia regenti]